MLQPREENGDLVRFHVRMLRDQLVLAILRVQVQQVMRLAEHLAALVQLAHGHAHIVELGVIGQVDELLRAQPDVVHPAEGREEGDDDGGRRREAADGQRPFDDAADAHFQPVLALQRERGAPEVVGPVPFLPGRDVLDVPLRPFRELDGGHLHHRNAPRWGRCGRDRRRCRRSPGHRFQRIGLRNACLSKDYGNYFPFR